MTKHFKIICISLIGLFLFPLLFFPLSSDSVVFMNIARKILEGKTLYVDAIDLKPPLIYYLYIPVYLLSHGSEMIVRVLDIVYQTVIIFSGYYVIGRLTGDKRIAMGAGVLYALLYTSFGPQMTFQSDTHINLAAIWMVYFVLAKKPGLKINLLLGALTGLLFCIKYDLLLLYVPVFFFTWYYHDDRKKFRNLAVISLTQLAGVVLAVGAVSLPMAQPGVFSGFVEAFRFTSFYSSMPPLDADFIKWGLKETASIFADNFSLMYLSMFLASVVYFTRTAQQREKRTQTLQLLFIVLIALFCTVLIERKLYYYHFTRMFIIFSILSAYGARFLIGSFRENYYRHLLPGRLIIAAFILLAFVFSPLPRWVNLLRIPYCYVTNTESYDALFESETNPALARVQIGELTKFIKDNSSPADSLVSVSTGANSINLILGGMNTSAFEQSCFYLGIFKSPAYRERIEKEFQTARWIVIQNNDSHLYILGHKMPGWEALQKDTTLYPILQKNFGRVFETKNFYVYKRI